MYARKSTAFSPEVLLGIHQRSDVVLSELCCRAPGNSLRRPHVHLTIYQRPMAHMLSNDEAPPQIVCEVLRLPLKSPKGCHIGIKIENYANVLEREKKFFETGLSRWPLTGVDGD